MTRGKDRVIKDSRKDDEVFMEKYRNIFNLQAFNDGAGGGTGAAAATGSNATVDTRASGQDANGDTAREPIIYQSERKARRLARSNPEVKYGIQESEGVNAPINESSKDSAPTLDTSTEAKVEEKAESKPVDKKKAFRDLIANFVKLAPEAKFDNGTVMHGLYQNGRTRHIGLLATTGTIKSESYLLEIQKLFPDISVVGEACPMWVPLVENNEYHSQGADYFVQKHIQQLLDKDPKIDTIILGCTHYPLLIDKIKEFTPPHIRIVAQGEYVAQSLQDYFKRHPEMDDRCTKEGTCRFLTTESETKFEESASIFLHQENIQVERIILE